MYQGLGPSVILGRFVLIEGSSTMFVQEHHASRHTDDARLVELILKKQSEAQVVISSLIN